MRRLPSRLGPALLALALASCRRAGDGPGAAEAPAPPGVVRLGADSPKLRYLSVDTVGVRRERVVASFPAEVVMDEDHSVRVASPVNGRITRLLAEPGDHVAAGQPLARIASGDAAQAQSDLAKAEAALAQSSAALERARDLYAHHVIALKDLQQAESDERQARAERDRAEASLRRLDASGDAVSGEYVLRAPLRGDVVDRNANPGAEVRSDGAQTLFTISALDTVWLAISVFQRDLPEVRRGDRVVFTTDAAPGRRFEARVIRVSSALDPQTRTATLRAVLPNPGRLLRTQVIGEARLMARDDSHLPVVPTQALVTRGPDTVVFVEEAPGRFVRRTVRVSEDDGQTALIAAGLRPGERVVTRGSILLAGEADAGR